MNVVITLLALAAGASCTSADSAPADTARSAAPPSAAPVVSQGSARAPLTDEEKRFYRSVAQDAWQYFEGAYQPATGLVNGSPDWRNTTTWDIGSQILAFQAAKELGLLPAAEHQRRTERLLATLERMELFRGTAFNKQYSTTNGALARERSGWTPTDLGRLFVALKVLSVHEPQLAARIERIVRRNDFGKIVKGGYLHGEINGSRGRPWNYQEGRIGYEQYIAEGFARWGADVHNALDVRRNARSKRVMGVEILEDRRRQDRLLSEPFILHGLELGLSGDYRTLAENVLRLQEARWKQTGQVTIVSEDAVPVKPHYFYYYCVYCNGKPFVVDIATPGHDLDAPRWVSTKATFGWHALMPSDYTRTAMDYVARARDPKKGWATGVYERGGGSTGAFDINTSAVLMEVAWYQLRGGRPLIEP
ncbi:MAG: DUF3131 domain-containing protein [Gemmatimonadaceae bacterium]